MASEYKTRKTVEKRIDQTDHSPDKSKRGANRTIRHPMEDVARELAYRNWSGGIGKNALPTILNKAAENNPALAKQTLIGLQHRYGNQYVQRTIDLQKKDDSRDSVTPELEQIIQSKRGGGQPMDNATRHQMEAAFGQNFKNVRIHSDGEADTLNRSLSARAFTTGQDIFFKQGEYDTAGSDGRKLLAHELTHVIQQTGETRLKMKISTPNDRYEQEADQMARDVVQRDQQSSQLAMKPGQIHRQIEEEEELQPKLLVQRQIEEEELQLKDQIEKGEELRRQSGDEGETTVQRPTKKTDVPEEYKQRQKEEWYNRARKGHTLFIRMMKTPYNPGVMSKRYHMLPTEQQAKVIKIVDERFKWDCPGVTWKLNWEDPGDRPLARVWLRIRDRVMAGVWPKYVKSLSEGSTASIADMLEELTKEKPEKVEKEQPEKEKKLSDLDTLKKQHSKMLIAIDPEEIRKVENAAKPGKYYPVLMQDIRKEAVSFGYEGQYERPWIVIDIPSGMEFGKEKEKKLTFISSEGTVRSSKVTYKQFIPRKGMGDDKTGLPGLRHTSAKYFADNLANLAIIDDSVKKQLLELLNRKTREIEMKEVRDKAEAFYQNKLRIEEEFISRMRRYRSKEEYTANIMADSWKRWRKDILQVLLKDYPERQYAVSVLYRSYRKKMKRREMRWRHELKRIERKQEFPKVEPKAAPN